MRENLSSLLQQNLEDTLTQAIGYKTGSPALLIFDEQSPLSIVLAKTYRNLISGLPYFNFDHSTPSEILERIDRLLPGTLVLLVQSTSFRLNEFRFRIELFKRGLKVVEHVHLGRIKEGEFAVFFDSLAYDPAYYRSLGPALKKKMDACKRIRLVGRNTELLYDSPFEESKLNIGDYRNMKNTGGQFPIGEVFSEPIHLEAVNGSLEIFAFGGDEYDVVVPEQTFQLHIEKGSILEAEKAPESFLKILEKIRIEEEKVWIRELGFGLNRAFSRERRVSDIGAYERMCGIHISMGAKHAMYTKEGFPKKQCKYHVDIFPDVKKVLMDEEVVFEEDSYVLSSLIRDTSF